MIIFTRIAIATIITISTLLIKIQAAKMVAVKIIRDK